MAAVRGNTLILDSLQVAIVLGGVAAGGALVVKDRSDVGTQQTLLQADADAQLATVVAVPAGAPAVGAKVFIKDGAIPIANEAVDPAFVWIIRNYATTPDLGATVQALLQNAANPSKWIAVPATNLLSSS